MTMNGATALRCEARTGLCRASPKEPCRAFMLALPLPQALKPPWLQPNGGVGARFGRVAGTPQITAMWMAASGHAAYSRPGLSCLGLAAGDVTYRCRRPAA